MTVFKPKSSFLKKGPLFCTSIEISKHDPHIGMASGVVKPIIKKHTHVLSEYNTSCF